jgi:hypothetical protein
MIARPAYAIVPGVRGVVSECAVADEGLGAGDAGDFGSAVSVASSANTGGEGAGYVTMFANLAG